jgi:DNA-binding transcriptional ArsR family regulator
MSRSPLLRAVPAEGHDPEADAARLNEVFFALSDPVRRSILTRLEAEPLLVSELAMPFEISLQAVSRHIQVLVRAGLVQQERSGRISKCSLDAQPLAEAASWLNQYSRYWQQQFDLLAAPLADIDERTAAERASSTPKLARQLSSRPSSQPQTDRTAGAKTARRRAR